MPLPAALLCAAHLIGVTVPADMPMPVVARQVPTEAMCAQAMAEHADLAAQYGSGCRGLSNRYAIVAPTFAVEAHEWYHRLMETLGLPQDEETARMVERRAWECH